MREAHTHTVGGGFPSEKGAALVKRIRRCKTHFQVLGFDERDEATDEAIKKRYRVLALQLHPDKCDIPGAKEAFQRVNVAHEILSDRSKRLAYEWELDDPSAAGSNNWVYQRYASPEGFWKVHEPAEEEKRAGWARPPKDWSDEKSHFGLKLLVMLWVAAVLGCMVARLAYDTVLQQLIWLWRDFYYTQYVRLTLPAVYVEFWIDRHGALFASLNGFSREITAEQFFGIFGDILGEMVERAAQEEVKTQWQEKPPKVDIRAKHKSAKRRPTKSAIRRKVGKRQIYVASESFLLLVILCHWTIIEGGIQASPDCF